MNDETATPPRGDGSGDDGATQPPPAATAPPTGQAPPGPGAAPYVSWAAGYDLIRPRHGRYLAGVCGALGRATKTDPLLWRVLIGVLSIFGIGIIVYLAVWLLTPAEGDTASPLEALFGRGYSTTSSTLTLVLGVVAVFVLGGVTNSFEMAVIAAIGLVVAALVVSRSNGGRAPRPQPGVTYLPPQYAAGPQPAPEYAAAATVPGPAPVTAVLPGEPTGYRPPFAPHGPYAPAPPPPPPPAAPVKPRPEPSRLGRLIFGVVLIALGLLAMVDMTGISIPGTVYVATALAVVGVGLVIGAWFGRARGWILLGILLGLALPMANAGDDWDRVRSQAGNVTWAPTTMDDLADRYEHRFGQATLDLTQLPLAGRDTRVRAQITAGDLRIIVPDGIDVTVNSDVNLGNANVFGRELNGAGVTDTQSDFGADGPGGGTLRIDLDVNAGNAEVTR
ncbi:PspC domain-containing protein [Catellatospora sp. KI3]|uniref:PspC domain-containing protein n=1 Tax=Catellatospora sp. KI3 TaxID=3041620 RepID=UPI002482BE9D|nr:PspC domain-containing protein [Catellatospora sp. KI3]MDI1460337.1 PspC domain-containing protein [Catellatospora sp. KI3]